jgi:hypothetical protein
MSYDRFDASGNVIEHYSDGDLVNCKTEASREPAVPQSLFVWGPNMSLAFLTGRIEDAVNVNEGTKPGLEEKNKMVRPVRPSSDAIATGDLS